ncbi:hypothetical protein CTheo_6350 [Ceratobasidium theobromae]|uniref:Uncharacterized protein n=1 Tax=Ceratobasidium theobromae TaxID=1582974 RepID=A0A5N5QFA2_9AGAM|nr:hypothetical protein CTheo_6350 [Ceratobasidium theobromae]
MAGTEGATRLANNIDFLNHVIGKLTSSSAAFQIFGAARTGLTDDQDAKTIADDALIILKSLNNAGEELRQVDLETRSTDWYLQWSDIPYRSMLMYAQLVAQQGAQYIDAFNGEIPYILRVPRSEVSGRLKKWFENNDGDRGLKKKTQEISQGFIDMSGKVKEIQRKFSEFAIGRGAEYDQDQKQLQDQIEKLQGKIASGESEAAKAQQTLNGILTGLTMVGGFFETISSYGQSEKERAAKKAVELLTGKTRVYTARVVVSTFALNVVDIIDRLGRFANSWATAHFDFIQFQYWVENDYNEELDFLFLKKVEALKCTAAAFAADMNKFAKVLEAVRQ